MPDQKTLKRIDKLGVDIDACANALKEIKKIGSPKWLKLNDKLFNLIAKREKLLDQMKRGVYDA